MKYAIVTYTNSNCRDIWKPYFGQLRKHANGIRSYVISDENPNESETIYLKSSNTDPYYKQWLDALLYVREEYIIYAQEDFILYDDVDIQKLDEFLYFLEKENYSYVRPIRCGFSPALDKISNQNCLYNVDSNSDDIFQMQITLWKKEDFVKVYASTASKKWFENYTWRQVCRDLKIKGAFAYNGESKRGQYHYDSKIYPYICTAVSRGKWNMNEYNKELHKIFEEYGIDPLIRGVRQSYKYDK